MTLNQAILDLQLKGLPNPSAVSVFLLYQKTDNRYSYDTQFDVKFSELLALQRNIQNNKPAI